MSAKPPPLAFQPAPRPQPRLDPADAARLAEATADLGFARPVSSPAKALRPAPDTQGVTPGEAAGSASLKIEVPGAVWTSLKIEAVRRRVTVKFLVLEALAQGGYEIDLANTPQDGRRLR